MSNTRKSKEQKKQERLADKCFRCGETSRIVEYKAKTGFPISKRMLETAKRLYSRDIDQDESIESKPYTNLSPKDKQIKTCVRCISDPSINRVLETGKFYSTPFEYFVLLSIRQAINDMRDGVLRNLVYTYDKKSDSDANEYDMTISNKPDNPSRVMLVEVDEKGHYEIDEYFDKDRLKETSFLNFYRKGKNVGGVKQNNDYGSATILRIRVGETGMYDSGNSNREQACVYEDTNDKGKGVRCVKIRDHGVFRRNIDEIIRHIRRFFSDNGDFNDNAYINMNDEKGIRTYRVNHKSSKPGGNDYTTVLAPYNYGEFVPSPVQSSRRSSSTKSSRSIISTSSSSSSESQGPSSIPQVGNTRQRTWSEVVSSSPVSPSRDITSRLTSLSISSINDDILPIINSILSNRQEIENKIGPKFNKLYSVSKKYDRNNKSVPMLKISTQIGKCEEYDADILKKVIKAMGITDSQISKMVQKDLCDILYAVYDGLQ
jgi:ribosomal protein L37E